MNETQNPRPEGSQKPLASPPLGEPRNEKARRSVPPLTDSQLRALRADHRETLLMAILAKYNLTLPPNAIAWRIPPQPVSGYIKGISLGEIKLLITDGIVAWFANSDDSTFFGHMQHFEPNPSDRPAFVAFRSNKGPSPKTKKIAALTEED